MSRRPALLRTPFVSWSLVALLGCGADEGSTGDDTGSSGSTGSGGPSSAETTAPTTTPAEGTSTAAPTSSGAETIADTGTDDTSGESTGPLVCPDAPPFDTDDPAIVRACTTRFYIAGGDNSRVTTSNDGGATWQSTYLDDIDGDDFVNEVVVYRGVVGAIGLFGVYADLGAGFSLIEDIAHSGFDSYGGQFGVQGDRLLLTDNAGTYASSDAAQWDALDPFPDGSHGPGFGGHHHGTAFGDGTYLVFQDQAYRRLADDTWTEDSLPGAPEVTGAAFGAGVFVVVGSDDQAGFVRTSADGVAWSDPVLDDDGGAPLGYPGGGVVYDGMQFTAYTQYSGVLGYRSTDGTTWTPIEVSHHIDRVAWDDGQFFAAGEDKLLVSDDGLAWTEAYALAEGETNFINGPRVAIGRVLK